MIRNNPFLERVVVTKKDLMYPATNTDTLTRDNKINPEKVWSEYDTEEGLE